MQFLGLRKLAIPGLVTVFAALSSAAIPVSGAAAQPFQGRPSPEMFRQMCADRPAAFEGRIAFLRAKLGIRPAQTAAWNQFLATANSVHAGADPCKEGPPPAGDARAVRTRLDAMLDKRDEARRAMKAASDRLSVALDAEQQQKLAEASLSPVFNRYRFMGMRGRP